MPRHLDAEARRAQLGEAVWQVILDQGVAAVSVRTVAAQAGLAVGSLRHVFPTRAQLVEFSAQLMVDRAVARIAATPPIDDPRANALSLVEQLLPLTPDSRAEFEVNLALFAEAPAVPGLVPIRDRAHQLIHGLCRRLVATLAGAESEGAAARLHALIDGLGFHLLHRPAGQDADWAVSIIEDEIARIAGRRVADGRRKR
jgi:AcrR family transcriptional regulator